jgi:hypothetical protein
MCLTGCNVKAGTLELSDPVREAEATRVAIAAYDESAQRAIERYAAQAQADQAWSEAEAARNALPATTLRNTLVATGIGTGTLVLVIGSALALVAWLNKRAACIYPNDAGIYPVIVRRTWNGTTIVHDPNRALGPTTIYTTPTIFNQLTAGQVATAQFPQAGGENAMLQLSTQAQAVSLLAATTRNQNEAHQARQLAQNLFGRPAICAPLPPVKPSSLELSHVERLLLEAEGD